jgi:hypothetical protein
MGLDMSHDAWHGAYSAFSRYRNQVAEAAGYALETIDGEYGRREYVRLDWDAFPDATIDGDWGDVVPDDALLYLIVHSDCEGHLEPEACARLADRLEDLMPKIRNIPKADFGPVRTAADKTQQLIDGLRRAASVPERLEFH